MIKVSVIGAGFAGLTVALRLAQKGYAVDVYEKSPHVGGLLGTDTLDLGIAEKAANALIRTEKSEALFQELGLAQSLPLKSSSKRFLYREKPRSWPLNFQESKEAFLKLFPLIIKKQFFTLKPKPHETLKHWGENQLTPALTKYLLGPAMQGIYANQIDDLSASLILNPLFNRPKSTKKYKGLLTGPGGMQDLINKLEHKCRDLGVNFHLNSQISIQDLKGSAIVIATSANAAHILTKDYAPTISQLLSQIKMSSLMSVTVFFEKFQTKFKGFGCLIPREMNIQTLGILMNSYIFKDRDKTYNETWIMGGYHNEQLLEKTDSQIIELIQKERQQVLQDSSKILSYRINRWSKALPYYDVDLEIILEKLSKENLPEGLYLHGNYLSGIGLSKILEKSDLIAAQIEKDYEKK